MEERQTRQQKETKWYFVKHQVIAVCVGVFEDHLHELLIVLSFL